MITATATTPLSITTRRMVRVEAGAGSRTPVRVVDGDSPPTLAGERGYHTTRSGRTVVRHPNAYRRAGGWYVVYHASTIRVEVGAGWLTDRGLVST